MSRFYYDLHLHSCLSPCGDNESTPASIAGMAKLNGLDIVALCDHNTTKNCPAFFEACEAYGLVPVAGMELTTAEDIHLVCLFESLEDAAVFDEALQEKRILIRNKPQIMGEQYIMDADDNVIGEEPNMLPNATTLPLDDAVNFARSHGAVIYPAHVDRPANGIIAVLGAFPADNAFTCAEFHDKARIEPLQREHPPLQSCFTVVSSDAHYLWNISEAVNAVELDCDPTDAELVRNKLFALLRGQAR